MNEHVLHRCLFRRGSAIRRRLARPLQGFTLIELLVVIVIIAVLAAIAIPTYLNQRQRAQDTAAVNLVRNGLTVAHTALAEKGSYKDVTEAMLEAIEEGVDWMEASEDLVALGDPPTISAATVALTAESQIAFYIDPSGTRFDLASRSASGNWFGIQVDTVQLAQTGYVKVKVVDGSGEEGW